jgi:hypothetical protein
MFFRQLDNCKSFHDRVIVSPVIVIPDWLWADAWQIAKNRERAIARDSLSWTSVSHSADYAHELA